MRHSGWNDKKISTFLNQQINKDPEKKKLKTTYKTPKRINKNANKEIDLNQVSFLYFGDVDLMSIEGLSHAIILGTIREIGSEGFHKFESAKHFTSWIRLAPNNKISGGKLLNSKTPKGSKRLKLALRNAVNAIGNLKDTPLQISLTQLFTAKVAL